MNDRWRNLRNSFFAGLLVVVPIAASLAILVASFNWLTNLILPEAVRQYLEQTDYPVFLYRVLALVFAMVVVIAVGWVTRLMVGKRLHSATENVIGRVPLLNKIYGFAKEISHTLLSGQKTMFQQVVLVEFPRAGIYAIGFLTGESGGEVQAKTADTVVNVFVPTTPNPTSGFLVMVPRNQLIWLQMTVAEGMKLVISGGAVVPPYTPPPGHGG